MVAIPSIRRDTRGWLSLSRPPSASVVILDAATQDDLDTQIAALPEPESILWVGSPGMAMALAKRLAPVAAASDVTVAARGDILVAIGSANPRSHRQADRIALEPGVTLLRAPVERMDDPGAVVRDIAQNAARMVADERFDVVIATGGDTMEAILDGLDIGAFEILQELEPGFPLGRASLGDGRELLDRHEGRRLRRRQHAASCDRAAPPWRLRIRTGFVMTQTALLAVTMGDASGIGPEIVAKTLAKGAERTVVFGSYVVMENIVHRLGLDLTVRRIAGPEEARSELGSIEIVEATQIIAPPPLGVVSAISGQASFDAIVAAIAAAKAGKVSGIVTAPINKEAMASAGIRYPGHTEILADYGGAKRVAMMLANDDIRTVLVTIHTSLRKAIDQADFDAQMSAIRLANEGGKALGIAAPRVAVAGLNPHAGEGGLFGDEEIRIIRPAIEAARAEGIDASGPWPGDTVYMQARKGRFDVVVAQYHDQGLIPVKYLGLEKGVNITLGLPFVRTSPDHGTAFDIAGRGIADTASLETALAYARRLVAAQIKTKEGVV